LTGLIRARTDVVVGWKGRGLVDVPAFIMGREERREGEIRRTDETARRSYCMS
jgi:hypothetical protein